MANNKRSNKKGANYKSKKIIWTWVAGIVAAVVLVTVFIIGATGVFVKNEKPEGDETAFTSATDVKDENEQAEDVPAEDTKEENVMTENTKVLVEMENGKEFIIELYPEYAPQTVQNFIDLVSDGFYDGVGFHRVVEGFMAQGGDPEGTGMGGSGVQIPGEFAANGFEANTLSHTRGVISMARSSDPDSASSQFFICYDDASFLDGSYAAFGKVIEGMDVVDAFLDVERTYNMSGELASPVEPIVMKSVTIIEE